MGFNRNLAGYIEGFASIAVNIVLFVLKLWAGVVSGSIALIADAWHTLADSISSIMVIVGIKLSSRKPDKKHPFGHGRWEHLTSIFIGFLLAVIGYEFLKESFFKFHHHGSAHFGLLAYAVTTASVLLKEGLAQYAFYVGRKTDNLSIKADGWHHRTDALSSVVVLIGMFFQGYFWWVDSALGSIVSIMIFYAAASVIREAINMLLGEKPSDELIKAVGAIIDESSSDQLSPHHYHIHNYGEHCELTFHIRFDGDKSIEYCHDIATVIENRILEEMNINATIHLEPTGVGEH